MNSKSGRRSLLEVFEVEFSKCCLTSCLGVNQLLAKSYQFGAEGRLFIQYFQSSLSIGKARIKKSGCRLLLEVFQRRVAMDEQQVWLPPTARGL